MRGATAAWQRMVRNIWSNVFLAAVALVVLLERKLGLGLCNVSVLGQAAQVAHLTVSSRATAPAAPLPRPGLALAPLLILLATPVLYT